ncbi:hypothetical protein JTB14_026750 [Gonioctena quinquepunctata]|nr:hypothetical protein JTB14_026750 [Gonioctena quinquepunctata]
MALAIESADILFGIVAVAHPLSWQFAAIHRKMKTNRCLLHSENMSQEELYALIQSDEEILVPPSDLKSECSDRDEGSEIQDMFTLHDVDELVLEDSPEYEDLSSD